MESLYLLVPVSILLVSVAAIFFLRAVTRGQFEDVERHALDILETTDENSDA